MKCSTKCLIDIHGLPKPWLAYVHLVKKKIFYHNTKTGESLWELPVEVRTTYGETVGDFNGNMAKMCSAQCAGLHDIDVMDCTEQDDVPGTSDKPATSMSKFVECEEMDVDFTEDFRQMRGIQYDQNVVDTDLRSEQLFSKNETSRDCAVFDTCSLIEDPKFVHDCIAKNICVVIPYRVLYELDKLKKIPAKSLSTTQLVQRANRVIHLLQGLRGSPLIYWESSAESFEDVDGFMISSVENINDDYILKCAYLIKSLLDSRNEGWETVLLTSDQLLLLKAHACRVPCITMKEAKEILRNSACSSTTTSCQYNVTITSQKTRIPTSGLSSITSVPMRNSSEPSACHFSTTKYGHEQECKNEICENETSVVTFSRIWKLLVKALRKRCETHPTKGENDICRLRECVSIFCRSPTEKNLSVLAQMTLWLYFYYFPRRKERRNTSYKILMRNGLHNELCGSSLKSQKLMKELRGFGCRQDLK